MYTVGTFILFNFIYQRAVKWYSLYLCNTYLPTSPNMSVFKIRHYIQPASLANAAGGVAFFKCGTVSVIQRLLFDDESTEYFSIVSIDKIGHGGRCV